MSFDHHAYRMSIILALKDIMEKQIRMGALGYTRARSAADEMQAVIPRRLGPEQMRAWVKAFVKKYPEFAAIEYHPSYLDDERGTLDSVTREVAMGLAEPIVSYVRYETREFTRKFKEPISVRIDAGGISILSSQAHYDAWSLAQGLKRDGWEPDESIEGVDLMKSEHVALQRDGKNHLIGTAVTVRFRRQRKS